MKKTKRWKLEDCYYGSGTKFDRNYVKNFEGSRLSMHALRNRRNWRGHKTWIHHKYTEGLIIKYVNKPVQALEEAYNRKVKEVKNAYSFREAYRNIIENYAKYSWRSNYKYIIDDEGIIKINPKYKHRKYYKKPTVKHWQLNYNVKHIINPGEIRTHYIETYSKASSGMKITTPIYLGKLYALFSDGIRFINVYHYSPSFLTDSNLNRDIKLQGKKERFEKEWCKVNIGIYSLNCFKMVLNRKRDYLQSIILSEDSTAESKERAQRELKWQPKYLRRNYGIGNFLNPVCKMADIESIPICKR